MKFTVEELDIISKRTDEEKNKRNHITREEMAIVGIGFEFIELEISDNVGSSNQLNSKYHGDAWMIMAKVSKTLYMHCTTWKHSKKNKKRRKKKF